VLLSNTRLVVPRSCRRAILSSLHAAHQGIVKTRKLANRLYYWPTMNAEIKTLIESCSPCQQLRPIKPPTIDNPKSATAPWERCGMDLFHYGSKDYLVVADEFSGYPFCVRLHKTATSNVLNALSDLIATFGYPKFIRSDGGPQFRSEFQDFCKAHDIRHELSAPYHPQSNGLAESAVKVCKHLLEKCDGNWNEFTQRLLEWRNTPRSIGEKSPAELFLSRQQKTSLPVYDPSPKPSYASVAKGSVDFHEGEQVWTYDPHKRRWNTATFISTRDTGSAFVRDADGSTFLRPKTMIRRSRPYATRSCDPVDRAHSPEPPAETGQESPRSLGRSQPIIPTTTRTRASQEVRQAPLQRRRSPRFGNGEFVNT